MTLLFFCRIAADFSLYFSFANFLLLFSSYERESAYIWPVVLLLASALLWRLIKEKNRILAAVALLLPCLTFFLTPGRLPLLICLPPWAYIACIAFFDLERGFSYAQYHDRFLRGLKLMGLLLLPLLFNPRVSFFTEAGRRILPYVLLYLTSGVLSLRLGRHHPDALGQRSLQAINILLLAFFLLLCLAFAYSGALPLALSLLALFYRYAIAPVLVFSALVLSFPIYGLFLLIRFLSGGSISGPVLVDLRDVAQDMEYLLADAGAGRSARPLLYAALLLLALCGLYVARKIFLRLIEEGSHAGEDAAITISRHKLSTSAGFSLDILPPSYPPDAIRHYYRRFLRLCDKQGLLTIPFQTSQDIAHAAACFLQEKNRGPLPDGNPVLAALPSLEGLRNLFLLARYDSDGGQILGREDALQAKAHYQIIRKAFEL